MKTFWEVLALGRSRIPGFILVAVLVSLGTGASLVEPWIYRAIIDDVAGVFVEPAPLARVELALERLARGRTTLVIAHHRSMLTDVDRVLVLRDGRIEQDGSPEELLRVDGYFRQMMTAQDGESA